MNSSNPEADIKKSYRKIDVFLIGLLAAGALIFGYFESNFFNTFLDHVLHLTPMHIALMVTLSAAAGLVMNFVWGIISDNSRSRFGRRRPFLLFGVVAGVTMILYSFSTNYLTCVILDVVIIGFFGSNAYYAGQRSLVPDLVEIEHRGRVNGLVNIIGSLGLLLAISTTLIANEFFTIPRGDGNIITRSGHFFLLSVGGGALILSGLLGFLFIKEESPDTLPPRNTFRAAMRDVLSIQELKKQNEFFKIILAITIFKSGLGLILPFLFNFIFSLGLSTQELILVIGIIAPFLFLFIYLLGKLTDLYGRKKFLPLVISICSIGFFSLPFLSLSRPLNLPLLTISITLVFVGAIGLLVPLDTWSQDLLPPGKRAQFLGILNIVNTISQMIGAICGGIIATLLGIPWIFAFVPLFLFGSIPLFLRVKETLKFDQ